MEERDGMVYFIVRDVRNNTTVRNVTMKSARDLWHYAITQHADYPEGPEDIEWQDGKAVLSKALRAGKMRYDLALRDAEGNVRVYYGVTDDGLTDTWKVLADQFAATHPEVPGPGNRAEHASSNLNVNARADDEDDDDGDVDDGLDTHFDDGDADGDDGDADGDA
jgi:hypothetical protein